MGIPYLDPNPSRRIKDRRVAIISGVMAGVVMIIWSYMGTPQYAVQGAPPIEVVQEIMPEEGAGLVREVGYKHLPNGDFLTVDTETLVRYLGEEDAQKLLDSGVVPMDNIHDEDDPEFAEVMHEFAAGISEQQERDANFNNVYGILHVIQDQPHLKRLDWEINYLSGEGESDKFVRSFWLHEDALYWEQYARRDLSFISRLTEDGGVLGSMKNLLGLE